MNYKVYQGTELKQTVTSKTAVMNGLQPNRTYEFGIQPNDGTRDGAKETISVTTRGIRFNIPKTLTVGSTITLRYEEYPLGIVPIGNEPSGMFGGGNKQSLSAKVISTANGSSVVEVAGNVIEVGGTNLLLDTETETGAMWLTPGNNLSAEKLNGCDVETQTGDWTSARYSFDDLKKRNVINTTDDFVFSAMIRVDPTLKDNPARIVFLSAATDKDFTTIGHIKDYADGYWHQISMVFKFLTNPTPTDAKAYNQSLRFELADSNGATVYWTQRQLEKGSVSTPYASFVDGDTFTAQPDGTCALFSEYKALYY